MPCSDSKAGDTLLDIHRVDRRALCHIERVKQRAFCHIQRVKQKDTVRYSESKAGEHCEILRESITKHN